MRNNPNPPPITGVVARITTQVTSHGQLFQTSIDYMADSFLVAGPATYLALANAWVSFNQNALLATLASDCVFNGVFAADLSIGLNPTQFGPALGGPQPGVVATMNSFADFTSAVVTKLTELKGQHGRGRNYMGPVPNIWADTALDVNNLNGAGIAAYDFFANRVLLTPLVVGPRTWKAVVSARPVLPSLLVSKAGLVTAFLTRPLLGTARRRKEGRGR